jgi:hypothetical protein
VRNLTFIFRQRAACILWLMRYLQQGERSLSGFGHHRGSFRIEPIE